MIFYLLGIDYSRATLEERESIYKRQTDIRSTDRAVLSTCNRFEIYGVAGNAGHATEDVAKLKRSFGTLGDRFYSAVDNREVFRHILALAAGLRSQIRGELEILDQIEKWVDAGGIPQPLEVLWKQAISIAKDIRNRSGLNKREYNIARFVLNNLSDTSVNGGKSKIVVIGTGKVAELFAKHVGPTANLYFVANKNHKKASELAGISGGKTLYFDDLAEILKDTDVLISATSSPHRVLGRQDIEKAVTGRKKALYIYDLATPRDVDPDVGNITGVKLVNMRDMSADFAAHAKKISGNIAFAEQLVEDSLEKIGDKLDENPFEGGSQAEQAINYTGEHNKAAHPAYRI